MYQSATPGFRNLDLRKPFRALTLYDLCTTRLLPVVFKTPLHYWASSNFEKERSGLVHNGSLLGAADDLSHNAATSVIAPAIMPLLPLGNSGHTIWVGKMHDPCLIAQNV